MSDHLVQFYEDDDFLIAGLSDYIGGAIASGHKGIAIATGEHLQGLEHTLKSRGLLDERGVATRGHYTGLRADRMLPLFMDQGMPDEQRFHDAIGSVICNAAGPANARLFVFGEMVAILCATAHCSLTANGKHDAAIEVERYFRTMPNYDREQTGSRIPVGRVGVPDDVAPLAVFLAGNGASYITGEIILVDGGLIARMGF